MMLMCSPFAQMFKLTGIMCYLKAFRLNSLSLWNTSILKPLSLYMLVTVLNYLMILLAIFEVQFSAVRKVKLDDFLWSKGIQFIYIFNIVVQRYIYWQWKPWYPIGLVSAAFHSSLEN